MQALATHKALGERTISKAHQVETTTSLGITWILQSPTTGHMPHGSTHSPTSLYHRGQAPTSSEAIEGGRVWTVPTETVFSQ